MVMVSSNRNCGPICDPLDDLMGLWPIVHEIANAPQLVVVVLGKRFQRSQVGVNIGNDDYLHKHLSIWCKDPSLGQGVRTLILSRFSWGGRLPDESRQGSSSARPFRSWRGGSSGEPLRPMHLQMHRKSIPVSRLHRVELSSNYHAFTGDPTAVLSNGSQPCPNQFCIGSASIFR
jgi:hypothetical protein